MVALAKRFVGSMIVGAALFATAASAAPSSVPSDFAGIRPTVAFAGIRPTVAFAGIRPTVAFAGIRPTVAD